MKNVTVTINFNVTEKDYKDTVKCMKDLAYELSKVDVFHDVDFDVKTK